MSEIATTSPRRPSRRKCLAGAAGLFAGTALLTGGGGLIRALPLSETVAGGGLLMRSRAGIAFQTPVELIVAGRDPHALDAAIDAAFAGVRAVEHASSLYRADGELTRLNREGRLERPSAHLLTLMRYALDLSRRSGGAFDPTVQPLWPLWATSHARGTRPTAAELQAVLAVVDWHGVTVDEAVIHFDRPGMAVTLNSINQGYAADVAMAILAAHGVEHAMVDTGEFGARGQRPGDDAEGPRDWRLGVVHPRDTAKLAFTLDPFRRFAATSGDYETFFSPDFRDHHIFDPRTGYSPPTWSSITVEAPSGLVADGLSTALFVLEREPLRRLLEAEPSCAAQLYDKAGRVVELLA